MRNIEANSSGQEEPEGSREEERKNLENELSKKTFLERYLREVQTREAPLRGSKNPERTRGEIFRFERGQILKAYKILRGQIEEARKRGEDAVEKKGLLKEIRGRAKILEKNLDTLEDQYYEEVKMVEVDTEFGHFSVPMVELDLRKEEDGEQGEDERTPYFFIPGMGSQDFHCSAAVSMALALRGHKVYVPAEIEQSSVKKPADFNEKVAERGDFSAHAEVFKETIRAAGLNEVNVIGHSLGATIALELAADADFHELNDLIVMEPLGIEEKGIKKLATQFGFSQVLLRFFPYAESRIKISPQKGSKSTADYSLYAEDAKILAKKLYPPEKLAEIKPRGRYQIWYGTDSPIMNVQETREAFSAAELIRAEDPEAKPVEIYEVKGAEHMWPVNSALGLERKLNAPRPDRQVTKVKLPDLEKSGVAGILKDLKRE